jgi:hypothetical protein
LWFSQATTGRGPSNHVPEIPAAIDSALPGSFQIANCSTFSRKDITGE